MSSDKDRPLYTRRRVIGLGAAALGATAAERVIPAYGAQGSTIDSYNWSGARVTSDLLPHLNPPANYFKKVKGTWKVPSVGPHTGAGGQELDSDKKSGPFRSATWIGLDGGTWGLKNSSYNVLLAGIYHKMGASGAEYTPFFGWDTGQAGDDVYLAPPFINPTIAIRPKETITVELEYFPGASPPYATATFTILGISPVTATFKFGSPPVPSGYTVEWIFERISKTNKPDSNYWTYHSLGNHDAVVFRDAVATTDQDTTISPDQGDSINMRRIEDWPEPPELLTEGTARSNQVEIKQRKDSA